MSNKSTPTNEQIIALLFIIAPQFSTTDPETLEKYALLIEQIGCMINSSVLGCCTLLAYANLLAHFLTMAKTPLLGTASNLSEGQLSIGLTANSTGNYFGSTPYGQAYLQIIGKYRIGAYVTNTRGFGHGEPCGC